MSQVLGTGAAIGVIALVITIMLLVLSVFNPAVALAIDQGQDPVTVIAIYGSFWSDIFLLLAGVSLFGAKTFLYGIMTLQHLPSVFNLLLSGDILGFLGAFAPYQNYLASVTGFLGELLESALLRMSNVITPGKVAALLEKLVAW